MNDELALLRRREESVRRLIREMISDAVRAGVFTLYLAFAGWAALWLALAGFADRPFTLTFRQVWQDAEAAVGGETVLAAAGACQASGLALVLTVAIATHANDSAAEGVGRQAVIRWLEGVAYGALILAGTVSAAGVLLLNWASSAGLAATAILVLWWVMACVLAAAIVDSRDRILIRVDEKILLKRKAEQEQSRWPSDPSRAESYWPVLWPTGLLPILLGVLLVWRGGWPGLSAVLLVAAVMFFAAWFAAWTHAADFVSRLVHGRGSMPAWLRWFAGLVSAALIIMVSLLYASLTIPSASQDGLTLLIASLLGLSPWLMWFANRLMGRYHRIIARELADEVSRLQKSIEADEVHLKHDCVGGHRAPQAVPGQTQ